MCIIFDTPDQHELIHAGKGNLTVGVCSNTSASILSYGKLPTYLPVKLVTKLTQYASSLFVPNRLISFASKSNWRHISNVRGESACALGAARRVGYRSMIKDLTGQRQHMKLLPDVFTRLLVEKAYEQEADQSDLLRLSGPECLHHGMHCASNCLVHSLNEVPFSRMKLISQSVKLALYPQFLPIQYRRKVMQKVLNTSLMKYLNDNLDPH